MSQKRIILTYGIPVSLPDKFKDFEAVDISNFNWKNKIPETGKILCDKTAYIYATKFLPSNRIARNIEELEEQTPESEKKEIIKKEEIKISAAVFDDIVVSARYNKQVDGNKVWLSQHHLKMIMKLVDVGCTIILLDEDGNIIKEIKNDR